MKRLTHRKRVTGRQGERGASIVESALILPVFIILIFGIIEFGAFFFDINNVRNAARDGAREGSSWASGPTADYHIIAQARRSLGNMNTRLGGIIIYKASGANADVPAACLADLVSGDDGEAGLCNVYSGTRVSTALEATFGAMDAAGMSTTYASKWDRKWPAPTRNDALSGTGTPDFIGVYVAATHKSVTGTVPQRTIKQRAVFLLEPQRADSL